MSLAQPLPLPSTTDWPEFSEVAAIPYGFGRELSSLGIPIDSQRTRFAWLAGRNGGVDSVTVDGESVQNWEWQNTTDPAGNAITEVRFSAPVQSAPAILGRGLTDPDTGDLIENPGRVVAFLYSLIGRTARNLDLFTSECFRRSLTVRGVLSSTLTGRGQISDIMQSCGAIWADSSPNFAVFYPDTVSGAPVATIEAGATAEWRLDDIYTRLRIRYGYSEAEGRHLGSVLVQSPSAIVTYGTRTLEVDARWLSTSAAALSLANRLLPHYARPRWRYEGTVPSIVYPGEIVTLPAGAGIPVAGDMLVLASRVNLGSRKSRVTVETVTGDLPTTETVQVSEAFSSLVRSPSTQALSDGVEFEITTADGRAIPEARVTLDGSVTRYADSAGLVIFPSYLFVPGTEHTIVATRQGYSDVRFTFTA